MAKILIVEDDSKTAQAISHGLRGAGHLCAIRHKGEGVLEFTKKEHPDLIILDVMMPGMSGFEVCRSIRRDDEVFKVPILIVSAMNSEEEVKHGLAQGADDYITKPFNMQTLMQRVDSLLGSSARGRDVDELTSLTDAEGCRRELQRRITRGDTFGLVYVEVLNVREFGRRRGPEKRDKAIRHVARALTQCGRAFPDEAIFVGHMGAGHFICIMAPSTAQQYCEVVRQAWTQHLASFYASVGMESSQLERDGNMLDLMFCVTAHEKHDGTSAKDLIEVVSRIRTTSLRAQGAGIHVDRRLGRGIG